MLPLSLLRCAIGHAILIELKNGETYNGQLASIDLWMNINLTSVIRTSKSGDEFWSLEDIYIRGNTIKYLRLPESVLDAAARQRQSRDQPRNRGRSGRGRTRGRGRGGRSGRGRSGARN